MITRVDRWVRWRVVKAAYERWEERHVRHRFSGWSVRRRLAVFVFTPTLLICCGGILSVPVLWFARVTVEAGKGAPSPEAAADEYLIRLSYNDPDGLLPLLDDGGQERLLSQWRTYQDAMRSTDPPPTRLDIKSLRSGPVVDGRAEVRAEVQAVWWGADDNGRLGGYSSSPRTWVIKTRNDDGWRVAGIDAPPWCGTGGYVPRYEGAGDGEPSAAPVPAVVPSSADPLKHPREMLKCGPRDPFRAWHSCPPTSSMPTE
ncbi:hypothetical protein [Actinoplanes lobatus]|uniref:Uncharacterized protein n=1 Tax=Actinoplanes lobatus TaxID=113568 RepID=A0A7W7HAS3_9ACTN|nr:hypothetical protein [Actinoplanes lobatus]MBB4747159.1 hypothetical protein [Actinoplanes lobatus]